MNKSKAEKRRERQARTRARREERREKRRAEQFGTVYREWLILQDCGTPGCDGRPPYVQPAHVRHTRGAGGKMKDQGPLCAECHRWEETASDAEFQERMGMTRDEFADRSWERFQAAMAAGRDLLVGDHPW